MNSESQNKYHVPIWHKYALSVYEASEYYGIGEKKIRYLISEYGDDGFALHIGNKAMIKRQLFEDFLNQMLSI